MPVFFIFGIGYNIYGGKVIEEAVRLDADVLQRADLPVRLVLQQRNRHVFQYEIRRCQDGASVGRCELRIGHDLNLYYYGNIGYRVWEEYRGHGYAFMGASLLLQLAPKVGMTYVLITVSPENTPSVRTCERLDGVLVATVKVPIWHPLYRANERVKMIYRYDLSGRA